jgi:two-component system sensor kinase FixL
MLLRCAAKGREAVFSGTPRTVLAAGLLIGVVAFIDWRVELDVAFGFLYVFPVILVGTVLPRWQIALVALLCAALADLFDPYPFVVPISLAHDILVFLSLAGTGFFANAVTTSRHQEREHLQTVEREVAARREAEQQLDFLVKTSPAAILTMTADGELLLANPAAHRLFRVASGSLPGRNIRNYVPVLGRVPLRTDAAHSVQSEVQCRGERDQGEGFLADVFFSTYETPAGPRLAALIVDISEALREREVSSLEQLLVGSRILMGAMSHEIRNVCSAIAIIAQNLVRSGHLAGNKDVEALGALVGTLGQIATNEITQSTEASEANGLELAETLADLRLVLDPYCEEAGIAVHWEIPTDLPAVWANRHRLLQVLLNLMRNSERALTDREVKRIDVRVSVSGDVVSITVTDTGPGLGSADHLFEPFQPGADSTGLGLYLSRALLRSFGGDLRYEPTVPACCFVIDLTVANANEMTAHVTEAHGTNPLVVGG